MLKNLMSLLKKSRNVKRIVMAFTAVIISCMLIVPAFAATLPSYATVVLYGGTYNVGLANSGPLYLIRTVTNRTYTFTYDSSQKSIQLLGFTSDGTREVIGSALANGSGSMTSGSRYNFSSGQCVYIADDKYEYVGLALNSSTESSGDTLAIKYSWNAFDGNGGTGSGGGTGAPPVDGDGNIGDAIGNVGTLTGSMFNVGSSLVSWLIANPIALIGIGFFILVALVGGIRRLISGV